MPDRSNMLPSMKNIFRCFTLKRIFLATLIIIILFAISCKKTGNNELLILENVNIKVGILPGIGGRVVLLSKPGMENILKSDQRLWQNPERYKPPITAFSDFKAFYGHIVWVGPQSEWWTRQDINKIRRNKKANWPPDPYLIYSRYEIVSKSDTHIKMVGPASPVSGVRLYKEISIDSSGIVTFTASAENMKNVNLSCDIWMNTRLDGFARGYVPIEKNGIQEFKINENKTIEITDWKIENDYFTFFPSLPEKPKTEQVQEVHLNPSTGFIAGFYSGQMLAIQFEKLDQSLIHPEHGQVELYNYVNESGDENLLELEAHGAYCSLIPAATMTLTERWEVLPYHGRANVADHIEFLETYLLKK